MNHNTKTKHFGIISLNLKVGVVYPQRFVTFSFEAYGTYIMVSKVDNEMQENIVANFH